MDSSRQAGNKGQGEGTKRPADEEAAEQQKKRQKQLHEQLMQQQRDELARRGIYSLNGLARSMRGRTASSGPPPVFNENIWKEDKEGKKRVEKERSVSPKTVVKKEDKTKK